MASELSCRELVELVTEFVEGALSGDELERFEQHLVYCGPCTVYVEQMRETIRLTGALREDDLEPAVADDLLEALRGWREGQA